MDILIAKYSFFILTKDSCFFIVAYAFLYFVSSPFWVKIPKTFPSESILQTNRDNEMQFGLKLKRFVRLDISLNFTWSIWTPSFLSKRNFIDSFSSQYVSYVELPNPLEIKLQKH